MRRLGRLAALAVLLLPPLLAGCRAEEQGRVINHEPGVYKGRTDQPLLPAQREALADRVRAQRGL